MGIFNSHPGSWLGLPDFGITEKVSDWLGGNRTYQGGSNLVGQQPFSGQVYNLPSSAPITSPAKTTTTNTAKTAVTNLPSPGGAYPQQTNLQNEIDQQTEALRNDINSGYDSYFGQLDSMLNTNLPQQQTAQQNIVNSQYEQGVSNLGSQQTQGLYDLNTERQKVQAGQTRSLKDLSSNMRNMFMAGNVYLGTRGAGDSSAANQYSYALTKLGNQQRGNLMTASAQSQQAIADKEFKLKNIYNTEVNNLGYTRDQKILEVATWFADAQRQILQAKASGQLQRSSDLQALSKSLLEQSLNKLTQIDTEAANRRLMLDQWATNNATTVQQLKQNMAAVSQYSAPNLNAYPLTGTPSVTTEGGYYVPSYSSGKTDEELKALRGY